jgi:nucleoside-diphosphate-sugar epimerase
VTSKEALATGAKRFIHVSTAQVYKAKKPADEKTKTDPWTAIAVAHLEAEQRIKAISGLNFIIVRPALVYGTADQLSLTPRLIIGSIHKDLKKKKWNAFTQKILDLTQFTLTMSLKPFISYAHAEIVEPFTILLIQTIPIKEKLTNYWNKFLELKLHF